MELQLITRHAMFRYDQCRCPDNVNFRVKPVIGASYQTLKEKLSGLGKDIQAVDPADLDYKVIKTQLA